MSKNKLGIDKKDIGTIIVASVALALVVFAFIKMFTGRNSKLESEAIRTTVHVYSEVNEAGEIVFYTMIEEYTDSGLHASVSYKPRTTTAPSTEETSGEIDGTVVFVTDENGEGVTDENGQPVTVIETTAPPATRIVPVTDENGKIVTTPDGLPATEAVTVTETTTETTTKDIWSEESTTKRINIPGDYTSETGTASTVVSEINRERTENGLSPLSNDGSLNTMARAYSLAKAMHTNPTSGATYYAKTSSGGSTIYNGVISNTSATSGDYSSIGVGIIKYKGEYYTTVILS